MNARNYSLIFLGGALFALALPARGDDTLHFNRDIRPILSHHCFQCHGPDARQRKAGLRLDSVESVQEKHALVAGKPDESEIIKRITTTKADEQMPPAASKLALTPQQIDTLKRWIAEGATYEPHWAFLPVSSAEAPAAQPGAWGRNEIDRFVLARLNSEGVAPAPEADKDTLLRRVTLDLTGLPPTLEEMDAFRADNAPDAYERVVDRLLASPAYGERMANSWLDVARYADTYGYQSDRPSNMWPWRDWVIRAFNENLPYDQFVLWQVAGDLLPNPTQDQVLATAFNRLHRQTNEGGSVLEEFRQEYVADRVRTFGTAFLGLTMECSRCHDHKFDPISQKNYYQLGAFFCNIDESGMYAHYTDSVPTPTALLFAPGQREQLETLRATVAAETAKFAQVTEAAAPRFQAWLGDPARATPAPAPIMYLPLDEIAEGKTPEPAGKRAATVGNVEVVEGHKGKAVRFSGDNQADVPGVGDFNRTQPFSVALWLKQPERLPHEVVVHFSRAREDAASRGWDLSLDDGKPTFTLAHFWPGDAIQVQADAPIALNEWAHVLVAYDGSSKAAGLALFVNGRAVPVHVVRDGLLKDITYEREKPGGLTLAARSRDTGFKGGLIDELMIFDRAITAIEAAAIASSEEIPAAVARAIASPDESLRGYYLAEVDAEVAAQRKVLQDAREAERALLQGINEIAVMKDMPQPREQHVLARGAYDAPKEVVQADAPEQIFAYPENAPRNRLGLAQWLLDPRNPLTSRVAVNRMWMQLFGRGIVATQEDFGTQGAPPTHPELLDWLASFFMNNGWDVKALNRMLVCSATYRQASAVRPELEERDPDNTLLARGPRARLGAEEMRDQALAASGLLVPEVGGPSVKPYQPAGLWEETGSESYKQDSGAALYRRSLYMFWKRTVPPPMMLTFDAVTREVCVARRETTQTPLQALVLLNEPAYVEASRALAERIAKREADATTRLADAFRALTGRAPEAKVLEVLKAAFDEQRALFAQHPEDAAKYLSTGASAHDTGLDPAEAAALTAVVQAIMNLEEAQVKS